MLPLLLAACLAVLSAGVDAEKLKVCKLQLPPSGNPPDIVYYQTGSGPQMRYAWSMVGLPTLFLSHTNVSRPCNQSITYTKPSAYRSNQSYGSVMIPDIQDTFGFAVVFTRVIEFEVSHEKAAGAFDVSQIFCSKYRTQTNCNGSSDDYQWYWLEHADVSFGTDTFRLEVPSANTSGLNLDIKIQVPEKKGESRLSSFPKTLFNDESSVFDLTIKFQKEKHPPRPFKDGRVALEMMLFNGPGVPGGIGNVRHSTSVDDEYTPSVFETVSYEFGGSSLTEGFMAWKPISYQTGGRKSTSSQQANYIFPVTNITELPRGLLTALFQNLSSIGTGTRLYMVFGTSGDETYINPGHMTWTAAVGSGKPPKEEISLAVIITISLGLGLPGLLVIGGGVFVFVKKKPWENVMRLTRRVRHRRGYIRVNE